MMVIGDGGDNGDDNIDKKKYDDIWNYFHQLSKCEIAQLGTVDTIGGINCHITYF